KKEKDPNAPKRPMTAFLYYSQDHRQAIIATNPGQPISEVAKLLGEKWKTATPQEKMRYEEMAARDKDRYNREMANYVP
ncbi:high mobility group box domain-containing protein, partial [Gorgonomyces haynaldii]